MIGIRIEIAVETGMTTADGGIIGLSPHDPNVAREAVHQEENAAAPDSETDGNAAALALGWTDVATVTIVGTIGVTIAEVTGKTTAERIGVLPDLEHPGVRGVTPVPGRTREMTGSAGAGHRAHELNGAIALALLSGLVGENRVPLVIRIGREIVVGISGTALVLLVALISAMPIKRRLSKRTKPRMWLPRRSSKRTKPRMWLPRRSSKRTKPRKRLPRRSSKRTKPRKRSSRRSMKAKWSTNGTEILAVEIAVGSVNVNVSAVVLRSVVIMATKEKKRRRRRIPPTVTGTVRAALAHRPIVQPVLPPDLIETKRRPGNKPRLGSASRKLNSTWPLKKRPERRACPSRVSTIERRERGTGTGTADGPLVIGRLT